MAAAKLHRDFVNLAAAGRAGWVTFGKKTAARIDNHSVLARDTGAALTFREEAEIFRVDDLGDREAVMQFGNVDVFRRDTGDLISSV